MDLNTCIYIYVYLKVFKHPIILLLFHVVSRLVVSRHVVSRLAVLLFHVVSRLAMLSFHVVSRLAVQNDVY